MSTNKANNLHSKQTKWAYRLCFLLAFLCAGYAIARVNIAAGDTIYLQSDDGDLYLSIARNMLEHAHFIQTARPIANFVVPPGLPFITTVVLFLTGGLSEFSVQAGFGDYAVGTAGPDMLGVLLFQYFVYGAAAGLMAVSALKLAENGLGAMQNGVFAWQKNGGKSAVPKALPWILAILIGLAVPAAYVWCSVQIRHPNPGFILTESYTVCLIALIVWLVVSGADPRKTTAAAFILTLFRPACSPLFLAALLWTVVRAIRDRVTRPPVHKRIHLYSIFVMVAVFVGVLGINTAVNWLETGHAIVLEDYGNLDVYLANNEVAPADWYHSGKVPQFASPRYHAILADPALTRYEQNEQAGEALREYVAANMETVLHNAGVRFYKLFFETWGPVWVAFLACFALQMVLKGLRWQQKVYLAAAAVILSVMPAFGLLVARYSAPMLPLFIVLIIGTAGWLVCLLATLPKREAAKAAEVPAPEASPAEPIQE